MNTPTGLKACASTRVPWHHDAATTAMLFSDNVRCSQGGEKTNQNRRPHLLMFLALRPQAYSSIIFGQNSIHPLDDLRWYRKIIPFGDGLLLFLKAYLCSVPVIVFAQQKYIEKQAVLSSDLSKQISVSRCQTADCFCLCQTGMPAIRSRAQESKIFHFPKRRRSAIADKSKHSNLKEFTYRL